MIYANKISCGAILFILDFSFQMPSMIESYETLKMINHTECDCVYKDHATIHRTTRVPMPWTRPTTTHAPMCKCPSNFKAVVDEDGQCGCNCTSNKYSTVDCQQQYEGKEGFTLSDRKFVNFFFLDFNSRF